jgi:secreted trypsin-like serine protease
VSFRRSLLPAAALLALCLAAPAPAAAIVHGQPVPENGIYPAQGVLRIDTDDTIPGYEEFCGGTLIGSRQFLTAARCTRDEFGDELPPGNFLVQLGDIERLPATPDAYGVDAIDVAPGFAHASKQNDAAVLTLDHVANYEPMRVVDSTETGLWGPGTVARVLGWGRTSTGGTRASVLREAAVPIIDDPRCESAHGAAFDAAVMVCAADALDTPLSEARDFCYDDWGGPLLVPDGGFFALAGIISSRGATCGDPAKPGIYTRIGTGALNSWVHDLTPEANFKLDHAPRAKEPVTLTSTSTHPEDVPGLGYFDTFRWDLDGDGDFDKSGKSVTTTFPAEGEYVVGIEASKAGGDKATAYFAFNVGADPTAPLPGQLAPPATTPTPTPPTAVAKPAGRLATIHSAKRPKVRRGRFNISVRFARTAPAGIAVVEVFRGKRKIGIARGRVRRGGTRRISVKLTPTGRRLLARSATKRLKLRVRVRVGRRVLRSKTLTVRR